ncbi:MAG: CapA family protein [Promethearchaeota archaeon]
MPYLKLLAVGDISLNVKNNEDPFKSVNHLFKEKDILFANLETVITNYDIPREQKLIYLRTSKENVVYLKNNKFDIINIANNHILDYGPKGFNDTLEVLNQNGILFIGAGNHKFNQPQIIIGKKDIKVGFLGYKEGRFNNTNNYIFINTICEKKIIFDIKKIKSKCDIVVISLHWGIENVFFPSPLQIKLAKKLIDAGAFLILGHHPHIVQGIEKYKNGLIVYSLGNFQFLSYKEKNKKSIILSVKINKYGIVDFEIIPVKINEEFKPFIMNKEESNKMLSFINAISQPILKGEITKNWWFGQIAREYITFNTQFWITRIKKYGIKHFLKFIEWLISPFNLQCYLALLKNIMK